MASVKFSCFWKNAQLSANQEAYHSAEELAQILYQLSQDSPYGQNFEEHIKFCKTLFQQDTQKNAETFSALFLVEEQSRVIGFLSARVIFEIVEVDFITIEKSFRNRGLAEQLFLQLESKLIEQNLDTNVSYRISLEVSTKNIAAVSFYQKIGFKTTSTRKNYYQNHEDAFVMFKSLYCPKTTVIGT